MSKTFHVTGLRLLSCHDHQLRSHRTAIISSYGSLRGTQASICSYRRRFPRHHEVFFTNSMLLWLTLWSVKFFMLFLYRRLVASLPNHLRWWWAVLGFC